MADEADPGNVLAAKNVGFRAAYRPAPRRATRQLRSTEIQNTASIPFALGDILQGPDVGQPAVFDDFEVFLGSELVTLGAKRTLTVVPEPTSIVLVSLLSVGLY